MYLSVTNVKNSSTVCLKVGKTFYTFLEFLYLSNPEPIRLITCRLLIYKLLQKNRIVFFPLEYNY